MLIDALKLPIDETIETEVCIVGAGPAGITLAREFVSTNFRVCLLESGRIDFDQKTQSLYQGKSVENLFGTLDDSRRLQFGGTANCWKIRIGDNQIGVRYVPLDKIDFEKRDWLAYSGWPFDKSHLDPFYERAQVVCKLGDFVYDAEAWQNEHTPQLSFIDNITTGMFQFGPRAVFTHEYREKINHASNITTYLNANLVEIETDETAKKVTRLRVACLSGKEFWVCAKVFILATGGIENARLLLISNKLQKAGLGNENDLVGRFFMDHPLVKCGKLIPSSSDIFQNTALYDLRRVNNIPVMGKLGLTEETMRREQLLNISAILFPIPKPYQLQAVNALKTLLAFMHNSAVRKDSIKHIRNVIAGLDYILPAAYGALIKQEPFLPSLAWGGWSYLRDIERRFSEFEVWHQTEQAPFPDNRVTLTTDRDRLGRQKVKLHWQWHDIDIDTIKRSQDMLKAEFARAGIGELQVERDGELPKLIHPGTHHHMGTTRMHDDPLQGVVDRNCKLHNVSNLFIAGSSVFPTGGFANPTLTIVALAIRLADHVKTVLNQ
ncbi:GMC oxidoreductase [Calothrix sp. PCC 7507]|uniref:GMC oxidoreductase n=1 Tax=Calothrix sp. PCC 7507 TaxID=99598 RepID=UPI00029EE80E|nr:GMC family oxidoreductase [Calothrix sp. PCC 7507]AFY34570.1 monooxygenase FAD-binding protein [Calothrix sp. PCC 7507]